jgi:hypothetical protein
LLAGFIGALALCVSIYSVHLQRQQIRAQVWPRLEFAFSNIPDFRFSLANHGVGPAIIHIVEVTVDGKPIKSWSEMSALLLAGQKRDQITSYLNYRVVPAGAEFNILQESNGPSAKILVEHFLERTHLRLCYCSVLDECWLMTDEKHSSVDRCPKIDVPFEN